MCLCVCLMMFPFDPLVQLTTSRFREFLFPLPSLLHVRFWVDVQPLMAQLEHIHNSSDNNREVVRHSKAQVVQPSDITVSHLVMKAAASAVMEVISPPSGSFVERGEQRIRARETREIRTRVACVRASVPAATTRG